MKDRSVAGQLARKMKLEERLKPKLRKFFDQISSDVRSIWVATRSIPSLNSFNLELTAILRDHYRAISKQFSTITRNDLKSSNSIFRLKQEENIDKEIVAFINEHSQEQSDAILRTTERNLQNIATTVIASAAINGIILTNSEVGDQIQSEFNSNSDNRIDTIAVTETQTVSEMIKFIEASTIASLISLVPGTQEMFKTWNTVLDEKTRISHVRADRQRVNVNQPFRVQGQNLKVPGDTSLGATVDNIINCLHPDSIIQVCDPVNLTRRIYEGKMITIETSFGNKLTITPNHPILTITGWKPARLINKSDNIITTTNIKTSKFSNFNIDDIKTSIEEIYNSIRIKAITMRVGTCNMNFHGDISNHNVDIISSNSLLRNTFKSFGIHIGNDIRFKNSDFLKGFFFSKSLFNKPLICCFHIAACIICFFSIPLTFIKRCLTHSKKHRFTFGSRDNTGFFKSISNDISRYTQFFTDFFYRKRFIKQITNESDLFNTSKIVKVHNSHYKGYVYNLEDTQSYYICNGIVNHNCRCTAIFNVRGEESPPFDIPRT